MNGYERWGFSYGSTMRAEFSLISYFHNSYLTKFDNFIILIVLSCDFIFVVLENFGCKNYFSIKNDGLRCIGNKRQILLQLFLPVVISAVWPVWLCPSKTRETKIND